MHTVESLRREGIKVKVMHLRSNDPRYNASPFYVHQYTGKLVECNAVTVVKVTKDDQEFIGKSYCGPKDQFCRKLGVRIALGRALKNIDKKSETVFDDFANNGQYEYDYSSE